MITSSTLNKYNSVFNVIIVMYMYVCCNDVMYVNTHCGYNSSAFVFFRKLHTMSMCLHILPVLHVLRYPLV